MAKDIEIAGQIFHGVNLGDSLKANRFIWILRHKGSGCYVLARPNRNEAGAWRFVSLMLPDERAAIEARGLIVAMLVQIRKEGREHKQRTQERQNAANKAHKESRKIAKELGLIHACR